MDPGSTKWTAVTLEAFVARGNDSQALTGRCDRGSGAELVGHRPSFMAKKSHPVSPCSSPSKGASLLLIAPGGQGRSSYRRRRSMGLVLALTPPGRCRTQ